MSDGEATKTKVVALEKLCNIVVDNFLIEIVYPTKITFKFSHFKFDFLKQLWMVKQPKQKL
jgi:hypothetical protein